jgi:HlyD family secretion protein
MSSSLGRSRRGVRWLVAFGLLGLTGLVSWRIRGRPAVACVQPYRGPLVQRVVLTGRVITPGTAQLGVVGLGTVRAVQVEAGDRVTAGQPLLRLQDAEQQAAVAKARAGIALASAQMGQVRQVSDRVADANLQQARAALDQARRDLARVEQLAQSGAASPQEVDRARDAVVSASSQVASAEARATGAKGADAQLAGARITEARASLKLAEARLAQTVLIAPSNGTILERHVEPGDIVQPGKVLLVLAREGEVGLEAQSDEKNLRWLRPGLKARVVADGHPDRPFEATLDWVSPAVDVERGTVAVRFSLLHPVAELRPDMTVSINLDVSRREKALLVPRSAGQHLRPALGPRRARRSYTPSPDQPGRDGKRRGRSAFRSARARATCGRIGGGCRGAGARLRG